MNWNQFKNWMGKARRLEPILFTAGPCTNILKWLCKCINYRWGDRWRQWPAVCARIIVCSGLVLLKLSQHFIHIIAKSHWTLQWFIQATQKTGPSPLLANIDITPSIHWLSLNRWELWGLSFFPGIILTRAAQRQTLASRSSHKLRLLHLY